MQPLRLTLGTIKSKRTRTRAHRFIMFAFLGNSTVGSGHDEQYAGVDGMVVIHTCNNRTCLNPAHLVVGTDKDNKNEDYTVPMEMREDLLAERQGM